MAEIETNLGNNDLNIFKEEILTHIREIETKLSKQINNKELEFNKDYKEFTDKINSLIENNKDMVSDLVTQKIKIEKISELEVFKNKVDSMLITHEVRIKNIIDDFEKFKTKYDKIVSDNLYVSGFIGNSCQFRNLSEYLFYNISEVSRMKLERDQIKREIKDLRNKMDGLMKNMITLNDNSVKLCNNYTDNKQEEFRKLLLVGQQEINQKSMEMRAMVVQIQSYTEKKANSLQNEYNKLLDMKVEFNNYIDEKYKSFEIKHDELNKKAINNSDNIENNKNKMENLNEEIKNVDKSVKDLAFQVRNFYCVNNKLAELLEKLGANPSNSEIAKLIFGTQTNNIVNSDNNKTVSVSPQQKVKINNSMNEDILKFALDDTQSFKNNLNNNRKSTVIGYTQKRNGVNYIGLKKISYKEDKYNLDSDNNSIITDNPLKNNLNNINIKQYEKQQNYKKKYKTKFNR